MTRGSIALISLTGAIVGVGWADNLQIDPREDNLLIIAQSLAKQDDHTLTAAVSATGYLAVFGRSDSGSHGMCQLNSGETLNLTAVGGISVQVSVTGSNTRVITNSKFTDIKPYGGNSSSSQTQDGYSPNTFTVHAADASDGCNTLKRYGAQGINADEYLILSQQQLPAPQLSRKRDGDSDGAPIPIVGNSLQFKVPLQSDSTKPSFQFKCADNQSASLGGLLPPLRLAKEIAGTGIVQPFIYLEGITDWSITVYPEGVEITRSRWSGKLEFTVSSRYKFNCRPDSHKRSILEVVDADNKANPVPQPQQFVVTWSPGWLAPTRTMTVECGGCTLQLVTDIPGQK